ncbi:MAG: DNA-binding protein WhiA [Firmicutes bacterium]|nr:DNA-binding protein WhiA [Bacillota bacterium]
MSFSQTAKHELARFLPQDLCCQKSELAAFLVFSGSVEMRGGHRSSLTVLTEMPDVARKIVTLAHKALDAETEVRARRKEKFKKNISYLVRIIPADPILEVLESLALLDRSRGSLAEVPWPLLRNSCCRWSFLRGAFLARGSVTDPEKTYHWEIVVEDEYMGEELIELVSLLGIHMGLAHRKGGFLVYSKASEQISDLLAGMGAYNAMLSLESTKVMKEMRNKVNRQVNCETANVDKTVRAAMRQLAAINKLEAAGKLRKLPAKLRDLAELRVANPSASLKELGELLDPPVGKSTVANRLRRLEQIAREIEG